MRIILIAVLAVFAGASQEQAKKDLESMQGKWMMIALEVDGQLVPENKLHGTVLTIKGDKYTTRVKDRDFETTITLNPAKKPREIDFVFSDGENKDKTLKGIYAIEGDTLKICRYLSAEKDRPTQFGTWPNTGLFMVTWNRKN